MLLEKSTKRAIRRHHRERLILKGIARLKESSWYTKEAEENIRLWATKRFNNWQSCSGHCCGNPRHHYKGKEKLTIQERKLGFSLNDFYD